MRWVWFSLGIVCVGLGGLGIVVPGLPTTVFFIAAAACFARSSPRLERWVLGLPAIGRAVSDYRAGLGMPRAAKIAATVSIVAFSGIGIWLASVAWARIAIAAAAVAGVVVVLSRVPTREQVLATRRSARRP